MTDSSSEGINLIAAYALQYTIQNVQLFKAVQYERGLCEKLACDHTMTKGEVLQILKKKLCSLKWHEQIFHSGQKEKCSKQKAGYNSHFLSPATSI